MRQHAETTVIFLMLWLLGAALPTAAEEVVFCRPNNMVSALAYVAEAQGYLAEEKLPIRFETATNFKICLDLIVAGKADLANGGDGPFVYIAGAEPPLKIIAFTQRNAATSIFARLDRGIHNVSDLKGRRVGYLPGTVSAFFLGAVLAKNQMTLKDLIAVPMQTPTMTQALIGGAVDAIVTWEPWGEHALEVLKENGIQIEDRTERFRGLLVASDRVIAANPAMLQSLLRALLKSQSYILGHTREAQTFLAKKIALPEEVLAEYWDRYGHDLALDRDTIQLLNRRFSLLKEIDRNYADRRPPDFSALIEARFLQSAAPELVDLEDR